MTNFIMNFRICYNPAQERYRVKRIWWGGLFFQYFKTFECSYGGGSWYMNYYTTEEEAKEAIGQYIKNLIEYKKFKAKNKWTCGSIYRA